VTVWLLVTATLALTDAFNPWAWLTPKEPPTERLTPEV
jgi:hypothetical protein